MENEPNFKIDMKNKKVLWVNPNTHERVKKLLSQTKIRNFDAMINTILDENVRMKVALKIKRKEGGKENGN